MISLITGLPGAGKTSLMVYMLMTRPDLQNRPLFVDGIPDLKIPTMPIPDGESMETWHIWAPTGAVLVIDEAQRIFRPRPAGSKVPEHIQELETHRHKGIDIFVLTQHPRLIDVNLRSLVGEHRNISRTMLGFKRVSYWQKCANPESKSDIAEAKNSIFTMKKEAFGMYKSAEEHTKMTGSLSIWVWLMPLLFFILTYLIFSVMKSYNKKTSSEPVKQEKVQQQSSGYINQPIQSASAVSESNQMMIQESVPVQNHNLAESDFEPTIKGQPWTAPIYNGLNRNIQSMPFPALCVIFDKKRCTCYTEQSTPIKEIDRATCIDYATNGIFNPYKSPSRNEVIQTDDGVYTDRAGVHEIDSSNVMTLGGKTLPSLSQGNQGSVAVIQ